MFAVEDRFSPRGEEGSRKPHARPHQTDQDAGVRLEAGKVSWMYVIQGLVLLSGKAMEVWWGGLEREQGVREGAG